MLALQKLLLVFTFTVSCQFSSGFNAQENKRWSNSLTTYGPNGGKTRTARQFSNHNWNDNGSDQSIKRFMQSDPKFDGTNLESMNKHFPSVPELPGFKWNSDSDIAKQKTDGHFKPIPHNRNTNWDDGVKQFVGGFKSSKDTFSKHVQNHNHNTFPTSIELNQLKEARNELRKHAPEMKNKNLEVSEMLPSLLHQENHRFMKSVPKISNFVSDDNHKPFPTPAGFGKLKQSREDLMKLLPEIKDKKWGASDILSGVLSQVGNSNWGGIAKLIPNGFKRSTDGFENTNKKWENDQISIQFPQSKGNVFKSVSQISSNNRDDGGEILFTLLQRSNDGFLESITKIGNAGQANTINKIFPSGFAQPEDQFLKPVPLVNNNIREYVGEMIKQSKDDILKPVSQLSNTNWGDNGETYLSRFKQSRDEFFKPVSLFNTDWRLL